VYIFLILKYCKKITGLNGRFGEYCKNGEKIFFNFLKLISENPPTTISSLIQNSDSLQSIKFPESGTELKWLANKDKNIINLGLVFDEETKRKEAARWFILGIQSTESDKNCRVAMEKWQKESGIFLKKNFFWKFSKFFKISENLFLKIFFEKIFSKNFLLITNPDAVGDVGCDVERLP